MCVHNLLRFARACAVPAMATREGGPPPSSPVSPGQGRSSGPVTIDVGECVRRGAVGALGVIPGTIAAHPFDVLKIRMQTTGERLGAAVRGVMGGGGRVSGLGGAAALYGGLGSAVQQKMITCGPMFLVAEVCTQTSMYVAGMSRGEACFFGSAVSGYATGSMAALAEYKKVLVSQKVPVGGAPGGTATWTYGAILAHRNTHGWHLLRRINAAGLRNGLFDSTFFGCQHLFQARYGLPPGQSYGLAAATAVLLGYSLDIAVKRQMMIPPYEIPGDFVKITQGLYRGRSFGDAFVRAHRGIFPKMIEFSINYSAIGVSSVYIVYMLSRLGATPPGQGAADE